MERRGLVAKVYYDVTLDDGRIGYISTYELIEHGANSDPVKAAVVCKRLNDPRAGLTPKQLEASCWSNSGPVNGT